MKPYLVLGVIFDVFAAGSSESLCEIVHEESVEETASKIISTLYFELLLIKLNGEA